MTSRGMLVGGSSGRAVGGSFERLAAGVNGGECTAEAGGDGRGDASLEPAGMKRFCGVAVPEWTCEAPC